MSFNDEYLKLRKKRLKEEEKKTDSSISPSGTAMVYSSHDIEADDDIAPVKQTTEETERKWFQKGAFEDGYQFGDLWNTVRGSTKDLETNVMAGILGIGEKVVDAGAYVVGGVGGLFSEDFKESTKDFIAKDLYDEKAVAEKLIEVRNPAYWFTKNEEENSVFGDKMDALAESGGQLLGTMALQGVGVPWYLTSGVTSFGSEAENAFNQGATYGEAGGSALISAGAEILTEKLFGGSGLGEKGLINLDKLTKGISNKVVKMVADVGVDMAAEGTEEVLSSVFGAVGQKLTHASDKEWNELLSREDLFEAYIGGAVLSGVANAGNVTKSAKYGRDYRTGLTENEQTVFDNEYNERIADAEKDGEKLTDKEKRKLYDEVMEDLAKGRISIDNIERYLGGDTYMDYKNTINEEDSLIKEYEELGNMKEADFTVMQRKRFNELDQQVADIKANNKRGQLKQQLSESTFNLAKDSRLVESYNEKARRSQAFEADLSKYDTTMQETVKKAVESGILNNTNRTHEFVDIVAKISADKGVPFDFTNNEKLKESGFAVEGVSVNGVYTKDGISLNMDSKKAWQTTVGHEITHVLEGTELYTELQNSLFEYAKSKGDYDGRVEALKSLYEGVEGANVDAELTADLVGEYLFTDSDFVNNLSVKHRNVFQKIYDEIKYLWKMVTAGSKEARELEKVKKVFDEAYRKSGTRVSETEATGETKYSLVEDQETIDFLENQDYITVYKAMSQIDGKLYPPMASQTYVEEEYTTKKGEKKTRRVRKLKNPSVLGRWQQAEERPDIAEKTYDAKKGYSSFDLLKSNGKTTGGVAYNPYEHTSNIVLNDQFAEAYQRPELVTVEYHIPKSELTSGYKAQYAKDAVGLTDWKAGGVAQKLTNSHRDVYLTRWSKPVRVLSDAEVAQKYKEILDKEEGISVPWNVVTPSLRAELEKVGVPIDYSDIKAGSSIRNFEAAMRGDYAEKPKKAKYSLSTDSEGKQLSKEQSDYFKDSKMRDENGNLKVMYHGSQDAGFHVFDPAHSDDETSLFFVDRNDVAASYSGTTETYEARTIRTAKDMNNFLAEIGYDHYKAVERNGKFELLENNEHVATKDTAQQIYEEFCWYEGVGEGDANYKVYLNLTNPLEVDAEGRNWNNVSREFSQELADSYNSLTAEEKDALMNLASWEDIGIFRDELRQALADTETGTPGSYDADFARNVRSAYEKLGGNKVNMYDLFTIASDGFSAESINQFAVKQMNTRDYAQRAKEQGYDGVIFKNIHDNGGYSNGSEGASTVAIAFDSNQIKSVANDKPTKNADIRYSLSSMASTFFGDENMSALAFEEADYKKTQGYKDYVNQCVNNLRQTAVDFDEVSARREVKDAIDGIVRVALASKRAGYDIYDDATKRDKKDSKNRLLFSSLEPNSDYFTSNDISTICDKRQNFADIYDDIVRAEEAKGVPQGKRFFDNVDNYFYLHKLMADKGLTQPCRQCYVESMRKNLAPMANAFLKLVRETDPNNTANDQLYEQKGKKKGELKSNNAATREWVRERLAEYGMSADSLTVEMLTTEDGLAQLKIQSPLIYEAFNSFYGQSKPKMPKSATPFRFGELTALLTDHNGKVKQNLVNRINSTGGFRLQSYSDFQIQNYTDVLQVIFEAGTLGLNGHAYTKVPAFLDATEGTNLKRNISIFMYKDGNEWKLDRNDSFPYSLEEIYDIVNADDSGNTGIIAVSQNKEMSAWIMANDNVGYGIPFHKSGMKMGTVRDTIVKENGREIRGYTGTIDHTKQQTEVWAKTTDEHKALTKVKHGINIYSFWDFNNAEGLSKNELIEKNVKAYIDACEEAGYIPKFRDYVMNNDKVLNDVLRYSKELGTVSHNATIEDISFEYKGYTIPYGYYKFLGDFGMFAPDGSASPQQALSLKNYDFDKAVAYFDDSEKLHRNEVLQQFSNGEERQRYRDSDLTAEQLTEIVKQKRGEIVQSVVDKTYSLSYEDEAPVRFRGSVPMSDMRLETEDIAPVQEDVAKIAKATPTISKMEQVEDDQTEDIAPTYDYEADRFASLGDEDAPPIDEDQPIKTVEDRIAAKLQNTLTELANNRRLRAEAIADYDQEIARLKAKYDAKKNKTTKAANDILRSIERLQRMRGNVDADYAKRISDLEQKAERLNSPEYKTATQRMEKQQEYTTLMENLVGDTSTWVDKKLGLSYKVNTLRRNLRDIVRDANGNRDIAKADAIYEELQGKYNHNEAILNRESRQIKNPYANMKFTKAEDAYIQMLGEFRHNPDTTLTEKVVKEFYEKHKGNIDVQKVDKAIEMARETYDSLLERVNEVLREQGMKEIPYRKGYFPHFTEEKQGFLAKLFNWKTQNNDIPTDIAGLTENFNPNRSWQSFNKQRKGDTTDYSFTRGLDTYVHGALDWIYHIEDIQKRRALENHIRYIHSEKGVKDKIDAIRKNENYDADEMQEQIDLVYKEAGNPLNNFVTDLRAGTNRLANKKSSLDRSMEEMTNRKIYSTMTNLSNRVTGNMVAGSVSSALTNFIPITQSWGEVSPISTLRAMGDTVRSIARDDGMIDKSDFLTNRLRKEENLYKTGWDKVGDKIGLLMEGVDNFTAQTVWRSKYLENINKGMSESEAIKNADQFAENVMAGRSRGNNPTIFDSKNPLVKVLTAFQLEVNNQYGYMFKDMPQDVGSKSKAKLVKGYAAMFIGAYAYNALYSSLTGRDAAFDPIGIIKDLFEDLFGDDEEEEPIENITGATMSLADNILEEVPFVGGLVGGGRIPISSALPYGEGIYETLSNTMTDIADEDWTSLTKEWLNPLYYLAMPMGGGQLKKTIQGLSMFDDDLPIAGSYTDSGKLRFPVDDTLGSRVQAGIFGQWANKNARDYFDNERQALTEKQTQEFIDLEIPIQEYWEYREGLKGLNSLAEKADYINSLDLQTWQKNVMINNLTDRKEDIDMTDYDDYSNFEEFDYAEKNPEKYAFLQENGVSYSEYKGFDEDSKEAWDWAYNNPEKYAFSKAISRDVVTYRKYVSDLYDIEADKDEKGDSIRGSRKEKVIDYVNNLDAEYGEKIILFKSQYKADDTYNEDIINYLNGRTDISYEEMEAILKELGFEVDSKGNIYW